MFNYYNLYPTMKKHLKTGVIEVNNYIDVDSGEIVDSDVKHHKFLAGSNDEFLLIYSSLLGVMKHFSMPQVRVYACLLRYADGIRFQIGKAWREAIAEETGLNERTIYNTINELEKLSLIYKHNGLYQLNARYAFKGSTQNRNGALKALIEIGCTDC